MLKSAIFFFKTLSNVRKLLSVANHIYVIVKFCEHNVKHNVCVLMQNRVHCGSEKILIEGEDEHIIKQNKNQLINENN